MRVWKIGVPLRGFVVGGQPALAARKRWGEWGAKLTSIATAYMKEP